MSQAGIISTTSGPVPPSVPTSFVTQNGTAVPAANVLIVDGFDSIENNDNGVITKGGVVGTGTANELDVIITNRIVITNTTTNLQTVTTTLFTPTNATAYTYKAFIVGYDTVGGFCAGGSIEGLMRKAAGVITIVGDSDTLDESDAALEPPINATSVDWNIIASGGDLVVQFIGVAGATINWKCLFTFIQVS